MPQKLRIDAPVANLLLCEGVRGRAKFIFLDKQLVLLDYCLEK